MIPRNVRDDPDLPLRQSEYGTRHEEVHRVLVMIRERKKASDIMEQRGDFKQQTVLGRKIVKRLQIVEQFHGMPRNSQSVT